MCIFGNSTEHNVARERCPPVNECFGQFFGRFGCIRIRPVEVNSPRELAVDVPDHESTASVCLEKTCATHEQSGCKTTSNKVAVCRLLRVIFLQAAGDSSNISACASAEHVPFVAGRLFDVA